MLALGHMHTWGVTPNATHTKKYTRASHCTYRTPAGHPRRLLKPSPPSDVRTAFSPTKQKTTKIHTLEYPCGENIFFSPTPTRSRTAKNHIALRGNILLSPKTRRYYKQPYSRLTLWRKQSLFTDKQQRNVKNHTLWGPFSSHLAAGTSTLRASNMSR